MAVGADSDEVTRPMGGNRQQLGGWIAVQHGREKAAVKSTAKPLSPMLEREIRVATKTGRTASPRDLATSRRDVHQKDVCARRGEAERQLRGGEAGCAEVDCDQYTVRG